MMAPLPKLIDILAAKETRLGAPFMDYQITVSRDGVNATEWFTYKGGDTTGLNPQVAAWLANNTPPTPVPYVAPDILEALEPYQFFAALKLSGVEAALTAYLDGLPDPAKTIAKAKFQHTLVFRPDNDLVLAAKAALGMTDKQFRTLWKMGEAIA
jgi:hypothetical protein